uniref:AlNc14C80G5268 protein n=1 Tax=Albugo laibachii Nc14 TaxID=890382 RepID=F0WF74_9STRA|nr:AlNc14C80G5268 [Albugo laibachii Nc14]|eukprot:CCA19856.1 AlNc14C80G5268 [Albugo laibachii Nc14]
MLPRKRPRNESCELRESLEVKDAKIDAKQCNLMRKGRSSSDIFTQESTESGTTNKKKWSSCTWKDPESILLLALEEDIAKDLDVSTSYGDITIDSEIFDRKRDEALLLRVCEDDDYDASE